MRQDVKFIRICIILPLLSVCAVANAYENTVYIWQRSWRPEIAASVDRIAHTGNGFKVLAGELQIQNGRIGFSRVPVKWEYLKERGSVTIDVRMRAGLAKHLAQNDLSMVAEYLSKNVNAVIEESSRAGVAIAGVEFDYDCPSGKLKDYARFIRAVRPRLDFRDRTLSLTALPTWFGRPDCKDLFNAVDRYVLQLHSFEPPKTGAVSRPIFPADKALGWFKQALSFRKQFSVSLPTYGYEAVYGKDGEFVGLRAETGVQYYGDGMKRAMVFADPAAIIQFLNAAAAAGSDHFLGVCWFRLPVNSDRFNWDMATLERVMKRETPRGHVRVEVVRNPGGEQELFLVNDGELNFPGEITVDVNWKGARPLYDVLSGFDHTDLPGGRGLCVRGKVPRVGHKKMIAWFRTADAGAVTISTSEVRYHEKR
jgi:hypothetical protein